jgi:hypothetical protein
MAERSTIPLAHQAKVIRLRNQAVAFCLSMRQDLYEDHGPQDLQATQCYVDNGLILEYRLRRSRDGSLKIEGICDGLDKSVNESDCKNRCGIESEIHSPADQNGSGRTHT